MALIGYTASKQENHKNKLKRQINFFKINFLFFFQNMDYNSNAEGH